MWSLSNFLGLFKKLINIDTTRKKLSHRHCPKRNCLFISSRLFCGIILRHNFLISQKIVAYCSLTGNERMQNFQGFICRLSIQHIVVNVIYGAENVVYWQTAAQATGLDHLLRWPNSHSLLLFSLIEILMMLWLNAADRRNTNMCVWVTVAVRS